MNIGVQLRVYRKSKSHSVQKVSELTGISADKIYKWEKGTRPSDAEDLLKIREYMAGKLETTPKKEAGKLESNGHQTAAFGAGDPDPTTVTLPTGDVKRTLADYIAIIELYNKTLSSAINAGLIDIKNSLKETEVNLARGQQEIKEQILVTATAAVQQLSGQVPGVSVPLTGADKGIGGKKKVRDGDGKSKDH